MHQRFLRPPFAPSHLRGSKPTAREPGRPTHYAGGPFRDNPAVGRYRPATVAATFQRQRFVRRCRRWCGAVLLGLPPTAYAGSGPGWPATSAAAYGYRVEPPPPATPLMMAVPVAPPSVYAPPEAERPEDQINGGGVHVDLNFRYLTDYNYRGISFNRASYTPATAAKQAEGRLHASNFQADGMLAFDLGKLPHPFVAVLANINDRDPLSRFQEIRPSAGFDYGLRPILVRVGVNAYIYPERERLDPSPNTAEAYVRLTLDDSYFFLTDKPILQPYVSAAYDYQLNNGWYIEAGLQHEFAFPDQGASVTPYFDVAYVSHFDRTFVAVSPQDSGFQHYDLGLTAELSLNHLFDLPKRYGTFDVQGYLTYTGKFSNPILANTEVWGGVGLKFRY